MEIRERLLVFLEFKALNKNRFYKLTGLSNGYLDKKGGVSGDATKKILEVFPELNHQWLINGEGPMLRVNEISETTAQKAAELLEKTVKLRSMVLSVNNQITQLSNEMTNFEASIRSFSHSVDVPEYTDTFSDLTTDGVLAAEKPKPRSRKK